LRLLPYVLGGRMQRQRKLLEMQEAAEPSADRLRDRIQNRRPRQQTLERAQGAVRSGARRLRQNVPSFRGLTGIRLMP
jgi:hypothetical protein